jgi:MEDS: MEthanogen/methylotroph, DcmR Sensory domain
MWRLGGMQIKGLEQELEELQVGEHLGMVYQDVQEKLSIIGPFIKYGLARGAYCVYVAAESPAEEIAAALNAAGVDVAQEEQRGNLHFLTKWQYHQGQELDPEMMVRVIRGLVEQARTQGCPGLWLAVEMTWTLDPEVNQEQLLRWEVIINHLLEGNPGVILCLYNQNQLAPLVLHSALRTHPFLVGKERMCQNPYY